MTKLPIRLLPALFIAALALGAGPASAANTDGSVSFSMTTASYSSQYNPNNVAALWVVNSNGVFVKTLCRHARTRVNYLYKWVAARGAYTNVDGVTSSTLTSQPQTHAVTWNCRDTNNAVVPDGTYYIRAEYTSANAQGPYTTNWCRFVKGATAFSTNYANLAAAGGQFSGMTLTYTPAAPATADIAIRAMGPASGSINASVAVQVTVTNLTANPASFSVVLSNVTAGAGSLIGSQQVASLAGGGATTVTITWNTAGLAEGTYLLKATAGPASGEVSLADNSMTNAVTLDTPVHDIAVGAPTIGSMIAPNTATNVSVAATNAGDFQETFVLVLRDVTAGQTIGTRTISNLLPRAATNVTFSWNTTGAALGDHALQAAASVVAGETVTDNNTNTAHVVVATGLETNTLIARTAAWKYFDQGLDIAASPWMQPSDGYYDGFWPSGPAPLGYGLPGLGTIVGYGGSTSLRNPTTYFRHEFTVDFAAVSATGRVMRAHGVVLYLNGVELARQNMPTGSVAYTTLASSRLQNSAATNFYGFVIDPAKLLVGRNELAAEVHLAQQTNTTHGFSLELTAVSPLVARSYRIAPTAVVPKGSVQIGDPLDVSIALVNQGNATAPFIVQLRDADTGAVLASQEVAPLAPGESTVVQLTWGTLGASAGSRTLQAVTVCNNVTNTVDMQTAAVTLSSPSFAPRAVNAAGSLGGRCNAVAVHENMVYLGCGATLEIWDAANPSAPVRRGSIRLPGNIEDLVAEEECVFAAAGASGVHFVDVDSPASPVHIATFNTSGHARGLALYDHYLYVADVLGGVRVLNVDEPQSPSLVGVYETAGPARAVAYSSQTLLTLDGFGGVQVLSAAVPSSPTYAGQYRGISSGLRLAAATGAGFVADANGGLHRINTSAPASPSLATNALLPDVAEAMAVVGSTLYVADGAGGLLALNPNTLAVLGTTAISGGEAADVAAGPSGTTLFVAGGFAGCLAYNISGDPQSPALLSQFGRVGRAVDAAARGPVVFVASDEAGLQVHNVAAPEDPTWLATAAAVTNPRSVAVSGGRAYVGDAQGGFTVLDISNAASPSVAARRLDTGLGMIRRVVAAGNAAAATDGRQVALIAIGDLATMAVVARAEPGGFIFDLAMTTSHVFAACGGSGVNIFSTGDLAAVGSYAPAGPALGISVSGSSAYVAMGGSGWQTLDVSNPAVPAPVQSSAGVVVSVGSSGALVFLADGQVTVQTVNVSTPLMPVSAQSFAALTRTLRVSAAGGLALASEDALGLAILNASPSDVDLDGLPDSWEQQIVDANTNTMQTAWDVDPSAVGPNLMTFYDSYVAGVTPTDPNSVFALESPDPAGLGPDSQVVIRWYSVSGRTYKVYKTTNLMAPWQPVATGVAATPPVNSYSDTMVTPNAYYMITVQ